MKYAEQRGASDEVLMWCRTVLAATEKKQALDQTEVEHIIDYLVSDAAPKRLRKMSYQQAKASADKWSAASQKKGRNLIDGPDDIKVIHDFGDGTKIVELLTKKAYQREGYLMRHCLGDYDPDRTVAYSYRDAKNDPHATFEVTREGDEISQIKGKGNGPIHPKYIEPILVFLEHVGKDVSTHDMKYLGYYHVDDKAKNLLSQFVDQNGKGPDYKTVRGNDYIYA